MPPLHYNTIAQISHALKAGETTSVEVTQAVLDRIKAVDNQVQAFLSLDTVDAIAQAHASDEQLPH